MKYYYMTWYNSMFHDSFKEQILYAKSKAQAKRLIKEAYSSVVSFKIEELKG